MTGSASSVAWTIVAVWATFAARAVLGGGKGMSNGEAKMFAAGAEYDRFMGRWSRLMAPELVAFAGVKDNDRVLDVGTGTGSLALAMVMNFVPNHYQAIAEMRRVTRPGGRISACVWDYGEGMASLRLFWDAEVALEPAIEPKDERHMKLSRSGELGDLWRKAGLVKVQEKPLTIDQAFSSFHDYWDPFTRGAGPAGAYVVTLSGERRRRLAARLRKRIFDNRGDRRFVLQARAWCVTGEVPNP